MLIKTSEKREEREEREEKYTQESRNDSTGVSELGSLCCEGLLTEGSLVERKMVKEGERSMSWSPRVMRIRPPVRRTSRFSTGFRMGS